VKSKNKIKFFSLEMFGMFLVLISILGIICLFAGEYLFGELGVNIRGFFFGIFGYASYLILLIASFYGILAVAGVNLRLNLSKKNVLLILLFIYSLACILHLSLNSFSGNYANYLKECYRAGFNSKASVGGIFLALTCGLVSKLLTQIGAYIFYFAIIVLVVAVYFKRFLDKKNENVVSNKRFGKKVSTDLNLPFAPEQNYSVNDGLSLPFGNVSYNQQYNATRVEEAYRPQTTSATFDDVIQKLNSKIQENTTTTDFEVGTSNSTREYKSYLDMVRADSSTTSPYSQNTSWDNYSNSVSEPISKQNSNNSFSETYSGAYLDESVANPNIFTPKTEKKDSFSIYNQDINQTKTETVSKNDFSSFETKESTVSHAFDDLLGKNKSDKFAEEIYQSLNEQTEEIKVVEEHNTSFEPSSNDLINKINGAISNSFSSSTSKPHYTEPIIEKKVETTYEDIKNYVFNAPKLSLFKSYDANEDKYKLQSFIDNSSEMIKTVIKSMTGHDMSVTETHHGPTFTRFDLPVPIGVAIKSLVALEEDMRVQLNSDAVRIAAVPRSNKVGVEVSNEERVTVGLKEILVSDEFQLAKPENAPFVVGKDVTGNSIVLNLADLTHILIAGSSGSGKSVFITSLLVSMMYKCSPKSLRMVICDPKGVDFIAFKGAPHLLVDEIIVDRPKISKTLDWAIKEMNDRYAKLQGCGVPNIAYYNKKMNGKDEMARIVLFIDEFADLVSGDKNILPKVQILAQKARAAGIHLILALQRPSKDIVSGDIKVNFSTRIALKVQSGIDSRIILDEGGAESLLTHGDMMFFTPLNPQIMRAQGPFISPEELMDVIDYLKENNKSIFDEKILDKINGVGDEGHSFGGSSDEDDRDLDVKKSALQYIIESGQTSISAIQRELRLGFNRAAVIHNWMVKQGYIGPSLENNKQEVKITQEDFDRLYGNK